MSRPATFKASDLKRAVKVFQDLGLPVGGAEIAPTGEIKVLTTAGEPLTPPPPANEGEPDPLAEWERRRGLSAA